MQKNTTIWVTLTFDKIYIQNGLFQFIKVIVSRILSIIIGKNGKINLRILYYIIFISSGIINT